MKVMVGCGIYAGFRGSKEHAYFAPQHVKKGFYPRNYNNKALAGKEYVAIVTMPNDKSHKLSVHNSYVRDTSDTFKYPVLESDPKNFGGSLSRLLDKIDPEQTRMYCYPASDSYIASYKREGKNGQFYHTKPYSEKACTKLLKEAAEIMGLPPNFRPHAFRSVCITRLANDNAVSTNEMMHVGRHTSVSASKNYHAIDSVSEAARLKALGIEVGSPLEETVGDLEKKPAAVKKEKVEESDDDTVLVALKEKLGTQKEKLEEQEVKVKDEQQQQPSGTQVGIDELKEMISETNAMILYKKEDEKRKKKVSLSPNQLIIEGLKEEVLSLKALLCQRNDALHTDQMIYDEMEVELREEIEDYRLKLKLALAENSELLRKLSSKLDKEQGEKKRKRV